ncbi:MAG: hypothetical protein WBA16_05895 [Nonlabens sp.]
MALNYLINQLICVRDRSGNPFSEVGAKRLQRIARPRLFDRGHALIKVTKPNYKF